MERTVRVDEHYELWVEETGSPVGSLVLLVMGANASGATWPDELVTRLGVRHRVVRYDHRDTGRSTRAFAAHPYAIRDLALDAVTVLDALGAGRAHVLGMSMGGTLVQLLLLDHPDRLLSATVLALVVEAPEDPVNPPPPAQHLASVIGGARLVTIPGLGHALPGSVLAPLAEAVLEHTSAVDGGHSG